MRLLFICTSKGARGPENHLTTLALSMQALGHQVEAVAHPDSFIAQTLAEREVRITPGQFRNALDPRGFCAVRRAIRTFQPQWLIGALGHEYWPLLACGWLSGTPVMLFRHVNARLNVWTRWALPRLSARFIAVSASLRTNLILQGLPPEFVQLIYNPIDLSAFCIDLPLREKVRASLGVSDRQVLVGYVGGLETSKGPLCLAEAFNQAMGERGDLVGLWVIPESQHSRLTASLDPRHISRHIIKGWTANVGPYYAAMDGLAVPSIWPEVFGRVAAEAQACGVPVLGSRIGGIPEAFLDGLTGFPVAPGEVTAWTAALETFSDLSGELRQQMGRAGAAFVAQRFGAEVIGKEFGALLERTATTASGVR